MDKKFILKMIIFNVLWVMWIVISVGLGYVIYNYAFPSQPIVIIPFSLLFLVMGGVVVFFVNKLIKKRGVAGGKPMKDVSEDTATPAVQVIEGKLTEVVGSDSLPAAVSAEEDLKDVEKLSN